MLHTSSFSGIVASSSFSLSKVIGFSVDEMELSHIWIAYSKWIKVNQSRVLANLHVSSQQCPAYTLAVGT
jgi:hypothetical protein